MLDGGVPADEWGFLERPLYLMAAMTGLRQGELLSLRWQDLDIAALKVRVRRAFVRGEFKEPKSVRDSRGVPMATELERALAALRVESNFTADEDLVFAHHSLGDRSCGQSSAGASSVRVGEPASGSCAFTT